MKVKQVIYSSAVTKNEKGFQIIAHSDGICRNYEENYEIEDVSCFSDASWFSHNFKQTTKCSKSRDGTRFYLSRVFNNGRDFTDRLGSIYTHTLVIDAKDYEETGCDPLVFEPFFKLDKKYDERCKISQCPHEDLLDNPLPELEIEPKRFGVSFGKILDRVDSKDDLENIYRVLLSGEKLAIFMDTQKDEMGFVRNLLMSIPKSLRTRTFLTLSTYPEKTYKKVDVAIISPRKYNFFTPDDRCYIDISLIESTRLSNLKTNISKNKYAASVNNYARELAEIVWKKDKNGLKRFKRDFKFGKRQAKQPIALYTT